MRTQLTNSETPITPVIDLHLDETPDNEADPPDNQGGGNAPSGAPEPDDADAADTGSESEQK
jgi:hypothetical protein